MRLLAVLQTDCPTCRLIAPYLNRLVAGGAPLCGLSQDPASATNAFARQMEIAFPLEVDVDCQRSIELGVATVPTLFLLDDEGRVVRQEPGFDKNVLNELAAVFRVAPVASMQDGAPAMKPGCSSRHLEPQNADANAPALDLHGLRGPRLRASPWLIATIRSNSASAHSEMACPLSRPRRIACAGCSAP